MSGRFLAVSGLSRAFGGLKAVQDLSFEVGRGEVLGLIGPNGSGKTTALTLLAGALKPDTGSIRLDGREIAGRSAHQVARLGVARTFQLVRPLPSLTVGENVLAGSAFVAGGWNAEGRRQTQALLDRVGLGGRSSQSPGALTYIDQKRLELARALAAEPKLLLLDEWLAGLTPTELSQGIELVRSIRADGIAIVLVEHVMEAIRSLCDRCVVMSSGRKVAEGTPAAVLSHPEVIRSYLGDDDA